MRAGQVPGAHLVANPGQRLAARRQLQSTTVNCSQPRALNRHLEAAGYLQALALDLNVHGLIGGSVVVKRDAVS